MTNTKQNYSCEIAQSAGVEELLPALQQKGKTAPNKCPGYDTEQSESEVPVILGLWSMRITPSLPLLPGPLWAGVVAPDRTLSIG